MYSFIKNSTQFPNKKVNISKVKNRRQLVNMCQTRDRVKGYNVLKKSRLRFFSIAFQFCLSNFVFNWQ